MSAKKPASKKTSGKKPVPQAGSKKATTAKVSRPARTPGKGPSKAPGKPSGKTAVAKSRYRVSVSTEPKLIGKVIEAEGLRAATAKLRAQWIQQAGGKRLPVGTVLERI